MIGGDGINDESNKTAPAPFERLFLGRFGFGQSCGLSVIA